MNIQASLKLRVTLVQFALFLSTFCSAESIIPDRSFDRNLIKPRVENLNCFVRTTYNSDIEKQIKGFVLLARNNSKRILGAATIYFPTIENKIRELGLPDDLKYLTVVESMLYPKAESHVGARGMWQLMPFVAEDFKLKINGLLDERFHVEKSSEAGLLFLKELYQRFGNWELALAAYNCGPNRLRKILNLSGKKTYWGVRHLLPKQTREFVPKLIAVKYLFNYYQNHGITPDFPSIDLQLTRSIAIDTDRSYHELAKLLGVNTRIIVALNPAYKYDPQMSGLSSVEIILPSRVVDALHLHSAVSDIEDELKFNFKVDRDSSENKYHKVYLKVSEPLTLNEFCQRHNLSQSQVWLWNKLNNEFLLEGQEIFVYEFHPLKFNYSINSHPAVIASVEMSQISSMAQSHSIKKNRKEQEEMAAFIGELSAQTFTKD